MRTIALLGLAFSATGCLTKQCSLIGFDPGLQLAIDAHAEPGHYRLEVSSGGDTLSLEYDLAPATEAKCVAPCTAAGDHLFLEAQGVFEVDGQLHALVRTQDREVPRQLTVRVFRADVMLAEEQLAPTHENVEVNGPGCGVDETGTATVTTPVP